MRSPLHLRTIWIWPSPATTYRLPIPTSSAPKPAEVFAASTPELCKEPPVAELAATVQEHLEQVPGGRRVVRAVQARELQDSCNPRLVREPQSPLMIRSST